MAVSFKQPRGTRAAFNAKATGGTLDVGQVYSLTDESGRLVVATATNAGTDIALRSDVVRGLSMHCAGKPANSEVIGGGIAPYAMTISQANSVCKALVAATGSTTLVIKKNGTQIGTIVFAASATTGTVTITSASVAAGDQVTLHNAATADATLADIDCLLKE